MNRNKSLGLYTSVLMIAVFSVPLAYTANWNPIPDTGVNWCTDDIHKYINCPSEFEAFYGQDAQYVGSAQPQFEDNGDGTVTDIQTGLLWEAATNADKDWSESKTYCSQLDLGDYQDWRLPEIFEWLTLVNYSRRNPVFDPIHGIGEDQSHWSATPLAGDGGQAWYVFSSMGIPDHFDVSETIRVKCVRGENTNPGVYVDEGLTVIDTVTFLTWQKTDDGQERNWEEALAYCESLSLDAETDWRLPNINELYSLVDYQSVNPSIDSAYFTADSEHYWTSTPSSRWPYAMTVNFRNGQGETREMDLERDLSNTRCVRDGLIRHPHLSVILAGTGEGSVEGATVPGGVVVLDCGSDCSSDPANGEIIKLTATAKTGSSFVRWAGDFVGSEDCEGDSGVCTMQMFEDAVVQAYFMPHGQLVVTKDGSGSGLVVSSPAGILCGDGTPGDCDQHYEFGTDVTLSAAAASGSVFWYWSGEGCSGNGNCVVNMDRARSVTATFAPEFVATYLLTATKSGNGLGTITSFPEGVDCGDEDCAKSFPIGSEVTLTASAGKDSVFGGWKGFPCFGTSPTCVVTMDRDWTQDAEFITDTTSDRQLTVTIQEGALGHTGSVRSNPTGIRCGSDCTELYPFKERVTLTATPSSDASFVGWSGDICTGSDLECVVPMTNSWQVTANFGPAAFMKLLTVTKDGGGRGTVSSKLIEGIDCGADCSEAYSQSTEITLIATPATGRDFIGWSGGGCSGTGDCQITLFSNTTVNATFEADPENLKLFKDGFEEEQN